MLVRFDKYWLHFLNFSRLYILKFEAIVALMRVRLRIQKVCQSVESGAFTLPNCFLKSHKGDLQDGSSVAKIRPDHFLLPENIF